jgi:hypothetical protein
MGTFHSFDTRDTVRILLEGRGREVGYFVVIAF